MNLKQKTKRIGQVITATITASIVGIALASPASAYYVGQKTTRCFTDGCSMYRVTSLSRDYDSRSCMDFRIATFTRYWGKAGPASYSEHQYTSFGC